MTPVHVAAAEGHPEIVEYLISIGANVTKRDKFKRTALIVSLKNNHVRIASILLAAGCPWNEPDSSDNYPLHYACAFGGIQAIDLLLKAGANINQLNSWKLSPVTVAFLKHHTNIVKKILAFPDINVNCKDDNGRTLIANAAFNFKIDNYSLVDILINKHKSNLKIMDIQKKYPSHHLLSNFGALDLNSGVITHQSSVIES